MSSAHLHKVQLLTLCQQHPGAIAIMTEMYKRFHHRSAYYKLCNELHSRRIYGYAIYHIWKEVCSQNYDTFLTCPVSSFIENLKRVIDKNF
jgi:hypothetical protein